MAVITPIGSSKPIEVAFGGTGAQTLTINGVLLGNTTGAVTATTAGTTGQVLTGVTGSAPTFQTPVTGLTWTVITGATQTIAVNNGYIANRGAGVAFTLPATAAVGDTFKLTNINAGGWTLAQAAGQTIELGNVATSVGVGGSLASTAIGDSIEVICTVANTNFQCISIVGNITYV